MSKILLRCLTGLVGLALSSGASAVVMDFSFTGTFGADDEVQLFNFTADGASTVELRSYSYGGGTQADGNVVSAGGFDPILAIFDSTGAFIAQNDDDGCAVSVTPDSNTGNFYDSCFESMLAAGAYTVALTQFNNFANGPNLANGFSQTGDPTFTSALGGCSNGQFCDVSGDDPFNNRTNAWAFDILNVETADDVVTAPEPATLALMGLGLVGIGFRRRKQPS